MGNSSTITRRKSEQKINQTQESDNDTRPEISAEVSDGILSDSSCSSEVKTPGASGRLTHNLTDEYQSDSISNTPENFDEDFTSGSPQIRRFYVSGRCPRVDDELAPVTLEPMEHEWMMCASDGQWESLHRLLVSDPTLITRKDFVTGFTCLHWAAKLGKHELIARLVNFAQEQQVSMNINARSSAGYTPLHLAAMHAHIEVVKLLVGAFGADIEARDYNGKRACQYLKNDIAQNILDIMGAFVETDAENADPGDATRWRLSRVLQANRRPLKAQNHSNGQEESESVVLTKHKSFPRKSSFSNKKPGFRKIRSRTQIIHSTSVFDRFEKEENVNPLRPKSSLFE
ncbi:ankyrin repeat domain-containing protein SOWAHC-like [Triplophysa rosa]|uniref:Ankyrin repeat domain-containing protein SOWAHC-like n=1 Tax=Triplophysa rosa TaxID=992332 RepID=A0A9W7W7Z8_TRIRA|nr:ankyrin repeat domain-containing protein SOWAHC-like [Triplophysa rosa]KAI7789360.1 putative ankyrin repeat domain-containing protein SOWAHC-like [Triplophysa rosa]